MVATSCAREQRFPPVHATYLWPFGGDQAVLGPDAGLHRSHPMHLGPRGYVYIVDNPVLPGVVKIGGTGGSVRRRVRQLFTTVVPQPFVLRRCFRVTDWRAAEARVHRALAEYRCSAGREFFAVPLAQAAAAAERACAPFARPDTGRPTVQRAPASRGHAAVPRFVAGGWSAGPDPLVAEFAVRPATRGRPDRRGSRRTSA